MFKRTRSIAVASALFASTAGIVGIVGAADDAKMKDLATYEVTITNMTEGQPLSPPVVATHDGKKHMWKDGGMASEGVRLVAEDGKTDMLMKEIKDDVTDAKSAGMEEKIMPGKSLTLQVKGKPGDVISAITMLAATNDGFTGVDNMPLPKDGEASKETMAYDAGTEENTEKSADVPAPSMGKGRVATEPAKEITHHPGIMGTGDLSKEKHGWAGPVAKITVKKM